MLLLWSHINHVFVMTVCLFLRLPLYVNHNTVLRSSNLCQAWGHMPLISALRRKKQEDLCELEGQPGLESDFQASLVLKASSKPARANQETLS